MTHCYDDSCPICNQEPCCCEPCPCCGEVDRCGVLDCHRCGKPMCECCGTDSMHFGCEAEVTGGLYIGSRPELATLPREDPDDGTTTQSTDE